MKVILLQDIKGVGKNGDIKDVATGYARNFLIPEGFAVIATSEKIKEIEEIKAREARQAEKELKEIESRVEKLEGIEITIPVKLNEKGEFFASIDIKNVANEIKKEYKIKISPKNIRLEKELKELGEYKAIVNFPHKLEAEINIIIVEDKKGKKKKPHEEDEE